MFPWFQFATFVARLQEVVGWRFRRRGIGLLLRRARYDRVFAWHGLQFFFNHKVAGCYDGILNNGGEIEIQHFINCVLATAAESSVHFVDVGANIGEVATLAACHPNVMTVTMFEPQAECLKVCAVNAALNGVQDKCEFRKTVLASQSGMIRFSVNQSSPQASTIAGDGPFGVQILASTLDAQALDRNVPYIVKLDVEGFELDVLAGGSEFIRKVRPLLIFEYNHLGRARFSLTSLRALLGEGYSIYRLISDGRLDRRVHQAWNCVAFHRDSLWQATCIPLLSVEQK